MRMPQLTKPLFAGLLSLALLLPACQPQASEGTQGAVVTVVDTVGGVIRVRNSGDAPEWTSSLVLRL